MSLPFSPNLLHDPTLRQPLPTICFPLCWFLSLPLCACHFLLLISSLQCPLILTACLPCFARPFLLNLSPFRDACPIFPNVSSSSLTLLHFPALSGQQTCPQIKCFSSHLLGKPHRDSVSSSGSHGGCCAPKPWLCLCQHGAAFISR